MSPNEFCGCDPPFSDLHNKIKAFNSIQFFFTYFVWRKIELRIFRKKCATLRKKDELCVITEENVDECRYCNLLCNKKGMNTDKS
jgi:hypothetical protein